MNATVAIVIAAHDEAPAIGRVVADCRRSVAGAEVLVVDDGSRDGTASVAAAAGARTIVLPRNVGKGAALRHGAAAIDADVLVVLDGDGQDDPREIPCLLDAIATADLVIGSRFLGRFDRGAIRPVDRFGNRMLTAAFNALYGTTLTDTQAGFRAIRLGLWRRASLRSRRYDVETEVLAAAVRHGARVVEVPVTRRARGHGASGLHAIRDGTRILGRMLASRVRPL